MSLEISIYALWRRRQALTLPVDPADHPIDLNFVEAYLESCRPRSWIEGLSL